MTSSNPGRLILVFAMVLLPTFAFAQEATVTGTVVDETGGVLPGVTVTAVNAATGNNFLGVTDERGSYRVPVRVGRYRITLELAGFASVAQEFEALVGQILTVNAQMKPSAVQESVTVTGEAKSRRSFRRALVLAATICQPSLSRALYSTAAA